ncbi:zinc finger protein 749-like [Phlebotomus argentipes]|uniref:zinc finger protein 749-like n=1 Tax=Phlebotomus argentipes TaxID=94469 RepID=UPI002892EE52|nr:zinc finger protein 749-like [Phlebotomus argentipes]
MDEKVEHEDVNCYYNLENQLIGAELEKEEYKLEEFLVFKNKKKEDVKKVESGGFVTFEITGDQILDVKQYKCSICPKIFKRKIYLTKHLKTHDRKKEYQCKICKKICKQPHALGMHMSIHTVQRNHQCSYCSKMFKSETFRKNHEIIHIVEPQLCPICKKLVKNAKRLKEHIRFKHKQSNTKLNNPKEMPKNKPKNELQKQSTHQVCNIISRDKNDKCIAKIAKKKSSAKYSNARSKGSNYPKIT